MHVSAVMKSGPLLLGTLALAATLAGAATTGSAGGAALRSGAAEPDGAIAYVRGAGQAGGDILVTSVDGSRTRQLTRTRGVHYLASSPDGRRIVFDRHVPGTVGPMGHRRSEIWTIDASSGEARRVTRGGSDTDPAWSNDGRHILFSRHLFNKAGDWADAIFSVRTDGGGLRRVTTPSVDDHGTCDFNAVSWPRHPEVVFVRDSYCDHGFGSEIDAVDAAGRPVTILAPVSAGDAFDYVTSPDFTPDGRVVAFDASPTVNPDSAEGLYVGRPDAGPVRRLTRDGQSPSWSSDGRWIAFIRSGDVWIMRADGSGARRVTHTPKIEQSPDWLPAAG